MKLWPVEHFWLTFFPDQCWSVNIVNKTYISSQFSKEIIDSSRASLQYIRKKAKKLLHLFLSSFNFLAPTAFFMKTSHNWVSASCEYSAASFHILSKLVLELVTCTAYGCSCCVSFHFYFLQGFLQRCTTFTQCRLTNWRIVLQICQEDSALTKRCYLWFQIHSKVGDKTQCLRDSRKKS